MFSHNTFMESDGSVYRCGNMSVAIVSEDDGPLEDTRQTNSQLGCRLAAIGDQIEAKRRETSSSSENESRPGENDLFDIDLQNDEFQIGSIKYFTRLFILNIQANSSDPVVLNVSFKV